MINGVKHCFKIGMLYHGSKDFVMLPMLVCGEGFKHRDLLCLLICNGVFYKVVARTTICVSGVEVAYIGSLYFASTSVFTAIDFADSAFANRRRPAPVRPDDEMADAFGESVTEK